ncbi:MULTISPECIES: SPJ_0845 family protein [Holzapfeliella]
MGLSFKNQNQLNDLFDKFATVPDEKKKKSEKNVTKEKEDKKK